MIIKAFGTFWIYIAENIYLCNPDKSNWKIELCFLRDQRSRLHVADVVDVGSSPQTATTRQKTADK
jgi:hypothetical protein